MLHLSRPNINHRKVLNAIINAKQNPRRCCLIAIRAAVLTAYEEYSAAAPSVDTLISVEMSADQREALIHCYDVETSPLAHLRGQLFTSIAAARCPYCGLSESSTLDHYLPKENQPEFAVFSANLVPCCATCNTRKRRLVVDKATSVRFFLHPYFDSLPETKFLQLDVTLASNSIRLRYHLSRPPGLARDAFLQLVSHFDRLSLADRYRIMSLDDLRGRHRAFERLYGPSQDATYLAAVLENDAHSLAEEYGLNHWRAVLYSTLARNAEFCDGGFMAIAAVN
jgi:hypothetical protein